MYSMVKSASVKLVISSLVNDFNVLVHITDNGVTDQSWYSMTDQGL